MEDFNILNSEEKERYFRQILIPEIGESGQILLKKSSVLIVGAGGLGSPQLLYLSAAGIGRIGIVDNDFVVLSNLNRQIIYNESDIGTVSKSQISAKILKQKNSNIILDVYDVRLSEENAPIIFKDYDIILDATDNFETRYLNNKVCFKLKKPWIFGGVRHFVGQYAVFDFRSGEGPCLNCIFPLEEDFKKSFVKEKENEINLSDSEKKQNELIDKGVIGVTPGIIGIFQALQAIKMFLGIGNSMSGYLVNEDLLSNTRKSVKIIREPNCEICGDKKLL